MSEKLNKDQLNSAPLGRTAEVAIAILNVLQDYPPALQSSAIGLVFVAVCNTFKADPVEVIAILQRMYEDAKMRVCIEGGAVKAYVEGELKEPADHSKDVNEANRQQAERKIELLNELDAQGSKRIWVPGSVEKKDGSGRRWDE